METLTKVVNEAKSYGLEFEVLWTAFNIIKNSPEKTIETALFEALNEWVK